MLVRLSIIRPMLFSVVEVLAMSRAWLLLLE
jgi:hypothetical protein